MSTIQLLDREPLLHWLAKEGLNEWAADVRRLCKLRYTRDYHGLYDQWYRAWHNLPDPTACQLSYEGGGVSVLPPGQAQSAGSLGDSLAIKETLMQFHPWRKGPFQFLDHLIDTEWRSDWKWDRLQQAIDFQNRTVLDVGCGNGYYGWRMLGNGARFVIGCEPLQLYNFQFEVFRKYTSLPEKHFVIPLMDTDLPDGLNAFDITCSMGVLYHRTSPIDHLKTLHSTLKPNGKLIVETLIVESEQPTVLVPQDRYAKMRNVWFIPSVPMLILWLQRCGFRNIQVVDVSITTLQEQRKTEWMTYESLPSFLETGDPAKTCEGYPAPVRAIVVAERSG